MFPDMIKCFPDMIVMFPDMIKCVPDRIVMFPDMIKLFPDMSKCFPDMIVVFFRTWSNVFPDMIVVFPDMIEKTPGTEKTPDTEKFTPDTTILDTLPDPVSKFSPPAGRGRMAESRPCPLCLALTLFLWKGSKKYSSTPCFFSKNLTGLKK